MNRTEALAALTEITTARTDVHGAAIGSGFFFADAVAALGDFGRAVRSLRTLTGAGRVRCTTVQIGGTFHDFYTAA